LLRVAERQPDLGSICVFHTPTEGPAAPGAWRGLGATGAVALEGEGLWAWAWARDLVGWGVRWDASGTARCMAIAGRPPKGGFPGGGPRGRRGTGKEETWLPVGGGEARTNREHHSPKTGPYTLTVSH